MYIARFENTYIVKRMPDSGAGHAPDCQSYETPADLSGRGQVEGQAIQHEGDGQTNLKLAFSLRKNTGTDTHGEPGEHTEAEATGTRLSLRGFLHYLWDESGLSRWVPGMEGKRNWFVVRKYLMLAAEAKETKRSALADVLFIPEYEKGRFAQAAAARRLARLKPIMGPGNARKKMMVLIGEVEDIASTRFGFNLRIRGLPNFPFSMTAELHKSFEKVCGKTRSFSKYVDNGNGHLVVIATFIVDDMGVPEIQKIAAMALNAQWLPVENQQDAELVEALSTARRSFHKHLRYNLPQNAPIASATVIDTDDSPVAVYMDAQEMIPAWASRQALDELMASSTLPGVMYHPLLPFPELPPARKARSTPPSESKASPPDAK